MFPVVLSNGGQLILSALKVGQYLGSYTGEKRGIKGVQPNAEAT